MQVYVRGLPHIEHAQFGLAGLLLAGACTGGLAVVFPWFPISFASTGGALVAVAHLFPRCRVRVHAAAAQDSVSVRKANRGQIEKAKRPTPDNRESAAVMVSLNRQTPQALCFSGKLNGANINIINAFTLLLFQRLKWQFVLKDGKAKAKTNVFNVPLLFKSL